MKANYSKCYLGYLNKLVDQSVGSETSKHNAFDLIDENL